MEKKEFLINDLKEKEKRLIDIEKQLKQVGKMCTENSIKLSDSLKMTAALYGCDVEGVLSEIISKIKEGEKCEKRI